MEGIGLSESVKALESQMPLTADPVYSRNLPITQTLRRFSVDEYHRLIDDGYFSSDERFELLEGLIVEKMPRNPPHDASIAIARRLIASRISANWHVRVQSAVTLADSEPEPDLAVVRGDERSYSARHPGPSDTPLVIEVSNSSLSDDREIKFRLYARSSVRVYWIINLIDHQIEIYSDPTGPGSSPQYRSRRVASISETVTLEVETGEAIEFLVRDFLP